MNEYIRLNSGDLSKLTKEEEKRRFDLGSKIRERVTFLYGNFPIWKIGIFRTPSGTSKIKVLDFCSSAGDFLLISSTSGDDYGHATCLFIDHDLKVIWHYDPYYEAANRAFHADMDRCISELLCKDYVFMGIDYKEKLSVQKQRKDNFCSTYVYMYWIQRRKGMSHADTLQYILRAQPYEFYLSIGLEL